MIHSLGESKWRLLRRLLKGRDKTATFREARNWGRPGKAEREFDELIALGLVVRVGSAAEQDLQQYQITEAGVLAADMGEIEVEWEALKKILAMPRHARAAAGRRR